ncbi:hypothetical protein [Dysgonomonas sp. ZJ279]|uniref:hypothetical protein n=1 Tax=Dysgonomonas sp. ZJ279 TaxID=2709796 RepID=UPI0013EB9F4F|nr:hypothetical protein [Dysgonomonas sp. ZJ279]
MKNENVYLKEINWPEFGLASPIIYPEAEEIENRISKCREMMEHRNLTHLVVYGDREHFANLMYLAHFDPRFEEALMIISKEGAPLMLVGNECVGHLTVSPLYNAGKLRYERYQPFSLISQPRDESRGLAEILRGEGINDDSKVGCMGWKYYSDIEFADYQKAIEIPSFIVDKLRSICGYDNVLNASDILMSPAYGLKSILSAFEIAHFEFVNVMASEGLKNLFKNFRAGITDFELIAEHHYTGYPLGCHTGIKSSGNQHIGLSSPVGAIIKKGEPCSTGIAYWGSNICRAGWVAENESDLPEYAREYVQNLAAPYFYACAQWYETMKIGTKGKVFRELIDKLLPFDDFGVYLNPGHLIHFDEWVSSPIYKDSEDEIRSGMYLQVDIIPRSKKYFSSRMEDGIVIADEKLQKELKEQYPDTYNRCMARRTFMIEELGINLPEEILPLSNIPAIVPPFFLNSKKILSLKP